MPASRMPARQRSRLGLLSPANARIRSKLGLILVVPIAAILTLTAFRLVDATSRATDANRVGALTALSANASQVAHEVHRERMAAAAIVAAPTAAPDAFNRQIIATDAAVAAYRASRSSLTSVPSDVQGRLRRIDDQLHAIGNIRKEVNARSGPTSTAAVSVAHVLLRYGVVITELNSYREVLSQVTDDPQLADALRAASAFSKAKAGLDDEQALAFSTLRSGTF